MRQFSTQGIVLSRTDFGEADRILTFITPDHGKLRVMAKGVRKANAKLAGAIELFSVTDISVVAGRGDIHTLTSARLVKHYGRIVKYIERTDLAYEFIRILNRATEDKAEEAYFRILEESLAALNDPKIDPALTELWFKMQLIKIAGHSPNLHTDIRGTKLSESGTYDFEHDQMHFVPKLVKKGAYSTNHIKFLRLGFDDQRPAVLQRVRGAEELAATVQPLVQQMAASYLRI
jgi:DNA repair protein RecO